MGTMIVSIVLACIVGLIIYRMVKAKKSGKGGCGGSCGCCPNGAMCHGGHGKHN